MSTVDEINAALHGLTFIRRIEFSTDFLDGCCSIVLELIDDHSRPNEQVVVEVSGVADWRLEGLGGGMNQLTCLQLADVRHLQHDRINFALLDLDHERFSLRCRTVTAKRTRLR